MPCCAPQAHWLYIVCNCLGLKDVQFLLLEEQKLPSRYQVFYNFLGSNYKYTLKAQQLSQQWPLKSTDKVHWVHLISYGVLTLTVFLLWSASVNALVDLGHLPLAWFDFARAKCQTNQNPSAKSHLSMYVGLIQNKRNSIVYFLSAESGDAKPIRQQEKVSLHHLTVFLTTLTPLCFAFFPSVCSSFLKS